MYIVLEKDGLYPGSELLMDNKKPELTPRQNRLIAIKFFLFSISAGVIELVSYTLLHEFTNLDKVTHLDKVFGNEYGLTYFIALVLSVLWNFTLNRKLTFKSAANVPIAMLKVFAFYVVFAPTSIWWTVKLTGLGWNEYLVLGLTMVTNLVLEFLYCKFVVYRTSIYSNKQGQKELEQNK